MSFAAAVRPCGRSVCVHAVRGVFVFRVVFRYFGLFLVVRARIPAVSVSGSRYRPRIRPRRAGKRLRALLGPSRRVRGVRVRVGCQLRRICMCLMHFGCVLIVLGPDLRPEAAEGAGTCTMPSGHCPDRAASAPLSGLPGVLGL